jgi:hypothetical protein
MDGFCLPLFGIQRKVPWLCLCLRRSCGCKHAASNTTCNVDYEHRASNQWAPQATDYSARLRCRRNEMKVDIAVDAT